MCPQKETNHSKVNHNNNVDDKNTKNKEGRLGFRSYVFRTYTKHKLFSMGMYNNAQMFLLICVAFSFLFLLDLKITQVRLYQQVLALVLCSSFNLSSSKEHKELEKGWCVSSSWP